MAGFIWAYNLSGGHPLVYEFVMKDTETFTVGDMGNIETGQIDLAATGDTALVGPIDGATDPDDNVSGQPGRIAGTTAVTKVRAYANPDVVLSVTDANARLAGALLDVAGATGAQSVAASSNNEFICTRDSAATELTLVGINPGEHYLT